MPLPQLDAATRRPRDWLHDPQQFGKPRARWNPPTADATWADDLNFEAARAQHLIALYVRTEARRQQLTLADIGEATPFPNGHRHLGAVLRGEFPLTFRHLIALQTYFVDVVAFGDEVRKQAAPPRRPTPPHRR